MHRFLIAIAFGLVLLLPSCGSPLPREAPLLELRSRSGALLGELPPVTSLILSGAPQIPLNDIWLIEGEVSSVAEGRLRELNPTASLEEARVPLVSYRDGEEIIIVPSEILVAGGDYSIVALGIGLLGSLGVSTKAHRILHLWGGPPAHSGGKMIFCEAEPPREIVSASGLRLIDTSAAVEVQVSLGVDGDGFGQGLCLRVRASYESDEIVLPPASIGGLLLDPTPLVPDGKGDEREKCEIPCKSNRVGGACVTAEGGVFLVEFCEGAFLLEAKIEGRNGDEKSMFLLTSTSAERRAVVGPLKPKESYKVTVAELEVGGAHTATVEIQSGEGAPYLVLTEVLADPLGPEPESEWVEVKNIGTKKRSLLGLEIWDDTGGVALPDVSLAPGQTGLIVRSDFVTGADVLPHSEAVPIVVSSIGQNGLRNSGEKVQLVDEEGILLSEIPALSAQAGVSVVRIDQWSTDAEASFIEHPQPGASPGW